MTTTKTTRSGRATRSGPAPDIGPDSVFSYMLPSHGHRTDREMYEFLDAMVAARDERWERRRARFDRAVRIVRAVIPRPTSSPRHLPPASKHPAAGSSIVDRITHEHP